LTPPAQHSADTGQLLPGEDPSRLSADEIAHWVNVYEQLVTGLLRIGEWLSARGWETPAWSRIGQSAFAAD
jgi:hypothetical protein